MSSKKLFVPLSASSGGGGGGSSRKYLHRIYMQLALNTPNNKITISFDLVAEVNTPIPDVPTLCSILIELTTTKIKYGSNYNRNALFPVCSSLFMEAQDTSDFKADSGFIPAFMTYYKGGDTDHRFYLLGATANSAALVEHMVHIIQYNAITGTIDTILTKFTPTITDFVIEL